MNSSKTAIVLLLLTGALTSCQTLAPEVIVEYRDRPLPVIDWPTFPDPAGVVKYSLTTDTVVMPLDYWLAVTRYVIDAEAGIDVIEACRGQR